MIRNEFKFNELKNSRYELTVVYNGVRYQINNTSSGSILEVNMHIKYAQLMEELKGQLCIDDDNNGIQQYRNHCTAINGFMSFVGKTDEDRVGLEFKDHFDVTLNAYLESCTVGDRTKSDRRSLLNRWRSVFAGIEQRMKGGSKALSDFTMTLKQAVVDSGLSQVAIREKAGVSKSVFRQWLKGAQPNSRTHASVRRLELAVGLKRDTLINLIRAPIKADGSQFIGELPYRARLGELTKSPYKLREENVSQNLRSEWFDYFRFKTTERPQLSRNGSWRLKPKEECDSLTEFSTLGPMGCPTADFNWSQINNFLGFMCLSAESGGYGMDVCEVQSLALLAVPEFLQGFLEFKTHRSDGTKHKGMQTFAANVIAMTNPNTGYLAQQPQFLSKLPESIQQRHPDWGKMCAESHDLAKHWKRVSNETSRSPSEPIAPLLAMDEPMEPIFRMISALSDKAMTHPAGGVKEALCKRNALLIAMIVCNPMRLSNFKNLKWNASNTGNLYKTSDREWRLRFSKSQVKNEKGSDVRLPSWIGPMLEEYIEEYRDVLIHGTSNKYLFVARNGGASRWDALGKTVANITRTYAQETPGFGIHAFRHLVATVMLTKNPRDSLTVAQILGDDINTVIKHYAHLNRDASFDRYEAELEKFTNGYGKKTIKPAVAPKSPEIEGADHLYS